MIEEVGLVGELAERRDPLARVRDGLDPMSERVLEAMPAETPVGPLTLSITAGVAPDALRGTLLRLVAAGLVRGVPTATSGCQAPPTSWCPGAGACLLTTRDAPWTGDSAGGARGLGWREHVRVGRGVHSAPQRRAGVVTTVGAGGRTPPT